MVQAEIRDGQGAGSPAAADDSGDEGARSCAVTGRCLPKAAMIRFVIDPEGRPVPDLEEKLPGRGIWLAAERAVIEQAVRKNAFAKRARRAVDVDADLGERLEALLVRRCVNWVELARRADQVTAGFDEVRRRLEAGRGVKGGVLISARDGARDGRDKIERLAEGCTVSDALDADELGLAFGRERVVHALVAPGGLADSLARDAARLGGLRSAAALH